jgi:RNA polymerase sigma-70 factor (ECF subfamily)
MSRSPLRLVRSPAPAPPAAGAPDAGAVDPGDLDAVFRRYAPYVARIGARLLGRADEIDDLVQDVFLDAIRGLRSLREPGAIRGWLATVAVRHARRKLRLRAVWSMLGLDRADMEAIVDDAASPDERAQVIAVYRALDGVPADARIAWILSVVEGHALEEVAAIGGYSRATAHRRIQTAQRAVEAALRGP